MAKAQTQAQEGASKEELIKLQQERKEFQARMKE